MTSMVSETPRPMPRKLSSKFGSALAIFEQNSNATKECIEKNNTNSVVKRNFKFQKKKETSRETTTTTTKGTSSPHNDNEKSTAPAPVRRNFKIHKTVTQAEEPKRDSPKKSDEENKVQIRRNFKIDKTTTGQTPAARVVGKFEATKKNETSSTCDEKQIVQRNFKIPKKALAERAKKFEPTKINSSSSTTTNENNTAVVRRNFKISKTTEIKKQFDDSTTNNDSSATLQNVLHNLRSVKKDHVAIDKNCDASSPRSHRQEIELSTLSDTDEYLFDDDSEDGEEEYYELEISTDDDDEELWEEKTVDTEELWEEETLEEDIILTDDEEGDRQTPEIKLTNLTKS
jgi:hypothetical protein